MFHAINHFCFCRWYVPTRHYLLVYDMRSHTTLMYVMVLYTQPQPGCCPLSRPSLLSSAPAAAVLLLLVYRAAVYLHQPGAASASPSSTACTLTASSAASSASSAAASSTYDLVPATGGTFRLRKFAPWFSRVETQKLARLFFLAIGGKKRSSGLTFLCCFSFIISVLEAPFLRFFDDFRRIGQQ